MSNIKTIFRSPNDTEREDEGSWLPWILVTVAVGAFAIIEVIGTLFYNWNGSGVSLMLAIGRQIMHMFAIGTLVYYGTVMSMKWKASRR